MDNEQLEKEYEEVFDGEEKSLNLLKITRDKFELRREIIPIKSIGFSEPVKKGRSQTMIGLTKTVQELGVVTPIHVMTTEVGEDEDDEDSFKYILLDGLRRVFGAVKNNMSEIEAVIWDFHDKELGRQLALPLSLLLNRTQKRTWKEVWELYTVLEMQTQITPGTLEYLLQLEAGDAMKLKDVMLCDYTEVQEMLLSNEKTLDQCYKQLQKLRKEEDALDKEDNTGFSDTVEDAEEIVSNEKSPLLSDDDVMQLLELSDSIDENDIDEQDFEEMNAQGEVEHQTVGERHPVDPSIKQGTFQRDKFRCRCCGTGGVAFLGTLIYHHLVPVSDGGPDTIENGLTLCDSCHQILHITQKNGGRINMTKEQFDEYDEDTQRRIKFILKYAKVAVEADKIRGRNKKEIAADANISARHRMPGETLKETQRMFNASN